MDSSSTNTTLPWIFGLRPHLPHNNVRKLLALLLLNKFTALEKMKGEKTIESEKGLGLPVCWYWYIAKAYESYGLVISFSDASTSEWAEEEKGISPFDSGAIWHNHIVTNPPLSNKTEKVRFFREHDEKLLSWDKTIQSYVARNYDSFSDYIDGHHPKFGIPGIIKTPDDSQVWTWEAHVALNSIDGKIDLYKIFIDHDLKKSFTTWIKKTRDFQIAEKVQLFKWLESDNCVTCAKTETPPRTPYEVARQNLINLFI